MINIDDLVGLPYKKNGRGNGGYDCFGLAIEVERRFGRELPDIEESRELNYDFIVCEARCLSLISGLKLIDKPRNEGDVILFKSSKGIMSHIGIYLGNNRFIHCNKFGVHLEDVRKFDNVGRVYTWL